MFAVLLAVGEARVADATTATKGHRQPGVASAAWEEVHLRVASTCALDHPRAARRAQASQIDTIMKAWSSYTLLHHERAEAGQKGCGQLGLGSHDLEG